MVREIFQKNLREIEDDIKKMSDSVLLAVKNSMKSLIERDIEGSKKIIADDIKINTMRFEIEEKCIHLIATQQPMAGDMRIIIAILNIITELERIADHAEGIAKISVLIGEADFVKPLIDIPRMGEKVVSMLERVVKAFIERDIESAQKICNEDDEIDALHEQVYRELIYLMVANPKIIQGATYLIWVSHNLERIADRVTNIAERIVFMVTGKLVEMNVSKY